LGWEGGFPVETVKNPKPHKMLKNAARTPSRLHAVLDPATAEEVFLGTQFSGEFTNLREDRKLDRIDYARDDDKERNWTSYIYRKISQHTERQQSKIKYKP